MKFKKIDEGNYINPNLIYEFGVIPIHLERETIYIIKYWYIDGEDHQLPGHYETEEQANVALDNFMDDIS